MKVDIEGGGAMRSQWSAWSRRIGYGAAGILVLLCVGDATRAQSVGGIGIDPLAVLDLQVKPAAIVVLDSSGSMRERPECAGGCNDPRTNEVAGDDPGSKMWQAKSVLRNVVQRNQGRVRFLFGRYGQTSSSFGPENPPLLYSKVCAAGDVACQTAASAIVIGTSGGTSTGLTRSGTTPATSNNDNYFAPDGSIHYYLHGTAAAFYNNDSIRVQTTGSTTGGAITFGADVAPPPFQGPNVTVQNVTSGGALLGSPVVFTFRGISWNKGNAGCGGFQALVNLQPCGVLDQFSLIGPHLQNEVPLDASGNIVNYNRTAGNPIGLMPFAGIRSSGSTPIGDSLNALKTEFQTNIYPTRTPGQRTFVIFVTDGDDTCGGALNAAGKAELLNDRLVAADPTSSVVTYLITFGQGTSLNQSNWIAWGGSGMKKSSPAGSGNAWAAAPTAPERAACPTCIDAFTATNEAQLDAAIQAAIDQGQSTGEFAASPTITEAVFEYGARVSVDPLYPGSVPGVTEANPAPPPATVPKRDRYRAFVPVVIQPTFDVSNFGGKVSAFTDDGPDAGTAPDLVWEASSKLYSRIQITSPANFFQLHAGSGTAPASVGSSAALIKRRIFTTSRNGVFIGAAQAPVPLWPPTIGASVNAVAPNDDMISGFLDVPLGIMGVGADDTARFNDLQTRFQACRGVLPGAHPCLNATPSIRYGRARREAREMVLAFTAGASPVPGPSNGPARTADAAADILYAGRTSGIMAESTLAVPAIITPPLEDVPSAHAAEYLLYRDGPRDGAGNSVNMIDVGFGLRNPDKDRTSPSMSDPRLKPSMTVVYVPTNQMLHAFRAGPCPGSPAVCQDGPAAFNSDTGGEEIWGFVPYDQLGKLLERMFPQQRDPHTYVITTSPRFADVFVPGAHSLSTSGTTVNYAGKWRTMMVFGRGIGGKHYTAMDVTTPGAFTRAALSPFIVLPTMLWSRGNPDTTDGITLGSCAADAARLNNTNADCQAYRTMGQSWSVPAITTADPALNTTTRTPGGIEYVAYVGSGFAVNNTEGTNLYALDALTGDVIANRSVGEDSSRNTLPTTPVTPFFNGLIAPPTAFVPSRQSGGFVGNSVGGIAQRVYIADLHGRVFRFMTSDAAAPAADRAMGPAFNIHDLGPNQPVTQPAGLLNYDSDAIVASTGTPGAKPHIYVITGGDRRIKPPGTNPPFVQTPPFKMVGLRDDSLTGPATVLFADALNPSPTTGPGFRGTVGPVVTFNDQGKPRVFFAGTQLTPPGTSCASRLDSILFALTGIGGVAAYDLNGSGPDEYILFNNALINSLQLVWTPGGTGSLSISQGLGAGGAAPPPPPPPDESGNQQTQSTSVYTLGMKMSSPVCR